MPTLVRRALEASRPPELPLLALMLGSGEVWAVDPYTGEEQWRRPLRVFAEPAVHGRTAVLPLIGQELLAIDAYDGASRWQIPLPGEALTGLAVDDTMVLVTALSSRERYRSTLIGLSAFDGRPRWSRDSRELLGGPAAVAGYGFVPIGATVVALRTSSGRALGRLTAPEELALERVERHGDALLATSPRGFVDLYGGGRQFYAVDRGTVTPFEETAGFAGWVGKDDGVAFRLLAGLHPGAPRDAIFMARRVLMALRLDAKGRPVAVRWIHLQHEPEEFVALACANDEIVVAREDGALLRFDAATGRRAAGQIVVGAIEGAVFLGGASSTGLPRGAPNQTRPTLARMLLLLDDPDPRMSPAQHLVLDVLWRNPSPEVRAHVQDRAAAPGPLRAKAEALVRGPVWGYADEASLVALLERLRYPGAVQRPDFPASAQEVVDAGGPEALAWLLDRLDEPGTPAAALEAIMATVRRLDDPRAVEAVGAFVRRYHADPEVADESRAMELGLEFLLSQAGEPRPPRFPVQTHDEALAILREVLAAEFTAPRLRSFLAQRMR